MRPKNDVSKEPVGETEPPGRTLHRSLSISIEPVGSGYTQGEYVEALQASLESGSGVSGMKRGRGKFGGRA